MTMFFVTMGGIGYSIFGAAGLLALGLHNLATAISAYLQLSNGNDGNYTAKPYHPFLTFHSPAHSPSATDQRKGSVWSFKLRGFLYLVIAWLMVSVIHQLLSAADSDPLVKGHTAVHRFSALQSAVVLLLFLVSTVSLFIPGIDTRLFFILVSTSFCLQSSTSFSTSLQTSNLEGHLSSVSAYVAAFSSVFSLALALDPRLFAFEVGLWASIILQGFWNLQTGLTLYVDTFIPEGCHRLLDVPSGVDGSTKCDLEDSMLRAAAILNFLLVLYLLSVFLILVILYSFLSKVVSPVAGTGVRSRVGSYEALPTSDPSSTVNHNIQMKTLSGTQA